MSKARKGRRGASPGVIGAPEVIRRAPVTEHVPTQNAAQVSHLGGGATLIEYGLLASVIAVACIAAVNVLGTRIGAFVEKQSAQQEQARPAGSGAPVALATRPVQMGASE